MRTNRLRRGQAIVLGPGSGRSTGLIIQIRLGTATLPFLGFQAENGTMAVDVLAALRRYKSRQSIIAITVAAPSPVDAERALLVIAIHKKSMATGLATGGIEDRTGLQLILEHRHPLFIREQVAFEIIRTRIEAEIRNGTTRHLLCAGTGGLIKLGLDSYAAVIDQTRHGIRLFFGITFFIVVFDLVPLVGVTKVESINLAA